MKICLMHEWEKIEPNPSEMWFDYDGNEVLTYKCKCKKCGKEKYRKFLGRNIGNILDAIPPCAKRIG